MMNVSTGNFRETESTCIVLALPSEAGEEVRNLLRTSLKDHGTCHFVSTPSEQQRWVREGEIIFGLPEPALLLEASRLKWFQLSLSGHTPWSTSAHRQKGYQMTNSALVFDEPVAQHTLAMMLFFARGFHRTTLHQQQHEWNSLEIRKQCFLLGADEKVLIVGYGAIGRRLAQLLIPFGMKVVGIKRSLPATGPAEPPNVEIKPPEELPKLLPNARHIINILPAFEETRHYFDQKLFAAMTSGSYFYNVGRGSTVHQQDLIDALGSGRIAAAFLDVTDPEPLPPEYPLWKVPNLYITPHSAGGSMNEWLRLAKFFLVNFEKYRLGMPLVGKVF